MEEAEPLFKTNLLSNISIGDIKDSIFKSTASDILKSPDSRYIQGVFTTSGSNGNNDFFLPSEMAKALATTMIKPIDIDHVIIEKESMVDVLANEKVGSLSASLKLGTNTIIGAIYDAAFVNATTGEFVLANEMPGKLKDIYANLLEEDQKVINGDPDTRYDIVVAGILWRELFPKTVDQVVQEIKTGQRALSMEAFFSNYSWRIGAQVYNKEDAPHLESLFKSKGMVGNNKVDRILKNIIFGGVGAVDNPANKYAFDFMEVASLNKSCASLIQKEELKNTQGSALIMDKEQMDLITKAIASSTETLADKLDKTEALNKELSDLRVALSAKDESIDKLTVELDEVKASVVEKETEITNLKSEVAKASDTISTLTVDLDKAKAAEDAAKIEKLVASRIETLKAEDLLLDKDEKSVASLSDEDFNSLVEERKAIASKVKKTSETVPFVTFDTEALKRSAVASIGEKPAAKTDLDSILKRF